MPYQSATGAVVDMFAHATVLLLVASLDATLQVAGLFVCTIRAWDGPRTRDNNQWALYARRSSH